jgi:hypothetical protein
MKFYKSSLNSNNNRATYKKKIWCSGIAFIVFSGLFFYFLTLFTLGGYNFLISIFFLTIVSVSDALKGGVQILFGHQKRRSLPLGSDLP